MSHDSTFKRSKNVLKRSKNAVSLTSISTGLIIIPTYIKVTFCFAVHWPKHVDFDSPQNEGLEGARNFYLKTDLNVNVGVWHILPKDLIKSSQNQNATWFEKSLSDGRPIILYLHGNTGSRAREHRVELYKILQNLNYHVICFDYRGNYFELLINFYWFKTDPLRTK